MEHAMHKMPNGKMMQDSEMEGKHGKQHGGPKRKSGRQVRFLMSKGSPLTAAQKRKMEREMHEGKVTMVPSIRRPD